MARRNAPKPEPEEWTDDDDRPTQMGFELPDRVEDNPAEEAWDAPAKLSTPPAPSGLQRAEALARRLEEDSESQSLEPAEPAEENPGFWGRIFRRRKERLEYRRYPSRLDMPASPPKAASPSFDDAPMSESIQRAERESFDRTPASFETEPQPFARDPEAFRPGASAFEAEPEAFDAEPEAFDAEPEALAPVSETRKRPSVILKLARGTDPRATSEVGGPSAYAEDPVLLERTLQVPITLGPDAVRRGARLRLTLEVVVEVSETTGGTPSLGETQAA